MEANVVLYEIHRLMYFNSCYTTFKICNLNKIYLTFLRLSLSGIMGTLCMIISILHEFGKN